MGPLRAAAVVAVLACGATAASLDFQRIFRGNGSVKIGAIATDPDGNVYVAGTTKAFDFPVKDAYQSQNSGSAIMVSDDAGRTWRPIFIPQGRDASVHVPVVHPHNPDLLIASGSFGICRSTDAGSNWSTVLDLSPPAEGERIGYIDTVVFDPHDPSVVYAAALRGMLKSVDGGATWTLQAAELATGPYGYNPGIAVDPFRPRRIIYTFRDGAYVSLDAGATWRGLVLPAGLRYPSILIDPHTAGLWYVHGNQSAWRSSDAGASWSRMPVEGVEFHWLMIDPSLPGRLYASTHSGYYRSSDGGTTWAPPFDPEIGFSAFAVQPGNSDYLVISGRTKSTRGPAIMISTDSGRSWQTVGMTRQFDGFQFDPSRPTRLYAAGAPTADAFIAKLNPAGEIIFSTYLGGQGEESATALALDGQGNIYVAGQSESLDFPAASARLYPGFAPSLFAAKLDSAGRPMYATLFWDDRNDAVQAIAVDAGGRLHLAGTNGGGFVARLSQDGGTFEYWTAPVGMAASIALHPEGGVVLGGIMNHDGARVEVLRFGEDGALIQAAHLPVFPVKLLVGSDGRMFVTGTASVGIPPPVSSGAFQTTIETNCAHTSGGLFDKPRDRVGHMTDVWVAELDRDAEIVWATLLGGACREDAVDLALAPDGSVWVAGETYSQGLPAVDPLFGPPAPGFSVPFIAHLNVSGSRLLFSTWLDYGSSPLLAAPPGGEVYVAANVPTSWNAPSSYSGPIEGTLRRISPVPASSLGVSRVANAFDGREGPVAPREIVRIDVPALVPTAEINLGLSPAGGAPTELGGVAVEFNGVRARLVDVWRGGLVCIAPSALRGQTLATLVVLQGEVRSSTFYVPVVERKLTFFDQVRNEDGSLNSPNNPARVGSLVTFFFTGAGALDEPAVLEFQTPSYSYGRVPLPLLSAPGFVEGMYSARVLVPAADGAVTVSAYSMAQTKPFPEIYSSVPISVQR